MEQELLLEPVKEEPDNKDSLCRLCACSSQLLLPIFEGEGLDNRLPDIIEKCLPIQVTPRDVLPVQACYQCASTVLSWNEFKATCVEAELKLKAMFGENEISSSDMQMSPATSRDAYADIYDNLVPGLDSGDPASSCSESTSKGHPDQTQEIATEESVKGKPNTGDKERFIADVTEDNNDVVCLEEEIQSVTDIEKQSQIDHCYSRDKQVSGTDISPQQERSRPTSRSVLRPIAPHPVLPQPLVNFVPSISKTSTHSTRSKTVKNIVSKSQSSGPQIIIVVDKTGNGAASLAVPVNSDEKSGRLRATPKLKSPPLTIRSAASQTNYVPILPKLKDITVTRVAAGAKSTPVRSPPKASVTVVQGGNYPCKMCPAKFTNEMIFKRHMYLSHNVKKYSCPLCVSAFGKKMDLEVHIRQAHQNPPKKPKQTCMICKLSFDKVIDLKIHIRDNHRRNISRFELAVKEKKVILGVALTEKEVQMLKECHSRVDNKDVYNCTLCKKSWTNLDKTVAHIRTHTKELLYACETCGQRFNTRGVMHRHMQIHQNSKPFACDYCDKAFSSKQNRDDHHRFHTKEVKTVCESCGEFITSASMLYYHRKIHSGVNPYKCPYCDKAYSIRSLLKRHIRYHTGEKPHLCSVCGRGFKTSGQLRGHSAVHSDERPFSCDGCGTMMKTKKYLRRHTAICANYQSKTNCDK